MLLIDRPHCTVRAGSDPQTLLFLAASEAEGGPHLPRQDGIAASCNAASSWLQDPGRIRAKTAEPREMSPPPPRPRRCGQ